MSDKLTQLIAGGFRRVGQWEFDSDRRLQFTGKAPTEPGIYAVIVNGEIRYIGCAQRGIHRRFRKYRNPNNKGALAMRVRAYIVDALVSGAEVSVFALTTAAEPPVPWNGLPLDLIAGLEEGLIRQMQPVWNRRGLAALRKLAANNSN